MIEAHGLTKHYERVTAVDDLTLRVGRGEILALLGPNGAGKTTTTRMLAGILRPNAGGARVAGFDILTETEMVRAAVGVLTEQHGLYSRMRCGEYLDFFGALYGLTPVQRRARAQNLLSALKLEVDSDAWLAEFSKGMRQRLALVRALMHSPGVLLLDEPTSALDPESARVVRDLLRAMRAEGCTIMVCTHNLSEAEELADRIAIIRRGRLIAEGTAAELRMRMLGPAVFELRLAREHEDLLTALEGLAEVVDRTPARIRYRAADPGSANPEILRRVMERGGKVVELREVTPTLESVYLQAVAEEGAPPPAGEAK
ncbi:MAG: ABC transporter ATP-binding protein [Anaerolineales bacterium]|nr:ABC transporter ATP-binding protein [Anaerolineales bacterium]